MSHPHEVHLRQLRPTQITVGLIEVRFKRRALEALGAHAQREFLAAHVMPAVFGPASQVYITDHHHLARAALEAGIAKGYFQMEADLSSLELAPFWREMGTKHWAHPIDERGRRQPFSAIPEHLQELRDDVYRSLAGFVRTAGGFEKTPTAYAEFLWADFFRRRIVIGPSHADFERAVTQALQLAHSTAARELPGFVGKAP